MGPSARRRCRRRQCRCLPVLPCDAFSLNVAIQNTNCREREGPKVWQAREQTALDEYDAITVCKPAARCLLLRCLMPPLLWLSKAHWARC